MDDSSLDRLFSGDLNKLAPLPKRVTRLFISSTFTDMTQERNTLIERVYPRLKKYCRERYALDFQVVDMRWGVRDEATDDHQTVDLCSREISNCQRVSFGPNFVALIGDKYGYKPLPSKIKSAEYKSLRRCLLESDINTDFLDTWYREDTNAVVAEHLLQPISSILKNFTNKNEPDLQKVDQQIWQAIQKRLHELLYIGSARLVKQNRMSERDQIMKYSISVTEREVIEGCLNVNEAKRHCLVYVRSLVGIREHLNKCLVDQLSLDESGLSCKLSDSNKLNVLPTSMVAQNNIDLHKVKGTSQLNSNSKSSANLNNNNNNNSRRTSLKIGQNLISLTTGGAQTAATRKIELTRRLLAKFIDLKTNKHNAKWELDEEAQQALHSLRDEKLKFKLPPNNRNLKLYQVNWNETEGISPKSDEHKKYLNDLGEHFYAQIKRMIRGAVKEEQKNRATKTSGLTGEILQHSHYAIQVGRSIKGRSSELEQIKQYILSSFLPSGRSNTATMSTNAAERFDNGLQQCLPMFVYGLSGSGKTSVLARAATQAREWIKAARQRRLSSVQLQSFASISLQAQMEAQNLDKWDREPCIIMRFCCTTPASSSMVGVLTSICRQLQFNFYQFGPLNGMCMDLIENDSSWTTSNTLENHQRKLGQIPNNKSELAASQLPFSPIPSDFVRLVFTFRQLIDNCRHPLHRKRMFVIILDSIERLSSQAESDAQAKYSWLTSIEKLPSNVRLIVSCSSSDETGQSSTLASDFKYLKRHFLRAQFNLRRHFFEPPEAEEERYSSNSNHNNEDEEISLDLSSNSSSDNLVDRINSLSGDNRDKISGVASQRDQFNGYLKYRMLQRIVLPAVRLIHGSRGNLHDNVEVCGKDQSPKRIVGFAPSLSGTFFSPNDQIRASSSRTQAQTSMTSTIVTRGDDEQRSSDFEEFNKTGSTLVIGMLHIKPLGSKLALNILDKWLNEHGRKLTQQQWTIVERSFSHCSRPIFIKLTLSEVLHWKSYSTQGDTRGLTFGSAWLGELKSKNGHLTEGKHFAFELSKFIAENQCNLAKICPLPDEQSEDFSWQTLVMEQQWLNYLDYIQRKDQESDDCAQSSEIQQQDLIMRINTTTAHLNGARNKSRKISNCDQSTTAVSSSLAATVAASSTSTSLSLCHLSNTIEEAICQLFARIELQHGYLLTKHSLSYINASRSGICENELEDILSLDDVVLDDVFQYHLPPVRRIPPLLWTRIRNDLNDYLSERDVDGIVIGWHYAQFKLITEQRYLSEQKQSVYIHSILADYFLGKWADKAKPFRCTRQQVYLAAEQLDSAIQQSLRDSQQGLNRSSLSGRSTSNRLGSGSALHSGASFSVRNRLRSSDQHDQRLQWMQAKADRRVPHQPLFYMDSTFGGSNKQDLLEERSVKSAKSKSVSRDVEPIEQCSADELAKRRRYNLRKLTELPFHLMHSGRFVELASNVLFNYHWLSASINSIGQQSLFLDFDQTLECLIEESEKRLQAGQREDTFTEQATTIDKSGDDATHYLSLDSLESLIKQLRILIDTLRLSVSVINSDQQMLAPQLIGRLISVVDQFDEVPLESSKDETYLNRKNQQQQQVAKKNWLRDLIDQCYRYGCAGCALLPLAQCFQSADGLQLSSLECHKNPFGITAMAFSSDGKHLFGASKKIFMWDIATGEVVRDFEPPVVCSCIKDLKLAQNNGIGVAFSRENNLIAFDVQTQKVVSFACNDLKEPLNGLKLLDTLEAKTFLVWTDSLWRVLSLKGTLSDSFNLNMSNGAHQMDQNQWTKIEQEYEFDLGDNQTAERAVIHSIDVERKDHCDLTFLILVRGAEMKFITLELIGGKMDGFRNRMKLWQENSRMSAKLMCLCKNLSQLVYINLNGDIYLRRRRAQSWSNPKLIRSAQRNATQQLDSFSAKILALEIEPTKEIERFPGESAEDIDRLAEFEERIDHSEGDARPNEEYVFSKSETKESDSSLASAKSRRFQENPGLRFIKLLSPTQITVLYLEKSTPPNKPYKEKHCMLPRDIQNIAVAVNKCQTMSIIMQTEPHDENLKLIVSSSLRLLIYSLEREQLLENIDAHEARITSISLIPFKINDKKLSKIGQRSPLNGLEQESTRVAAAMSLASASMDSKIKIWNLANIGKQGRKICRLNNAIESMQLSKALPLVACLTKGGNELGIWNYLSLDIIARWSIFDLNLLAIQKGSDRKSQLELDEQLLNYEKLTITACGFSKNGRFMVATTSSHLVLFTIQELPTSTVSTNSRFDNSPSDISNQRTKNKFNFDNTFSQLLPPCFVVLKIKFVLQDSRLLIIGRYSKVLLDSNGERNATTKQLSNDETQSSLQSTSELTVKDEETSALLRRLEIICLSIPDCNKVYCIDFTTPICGTPNLLLNGMSNNESIMFQNNSLAAIQNRFGEKKLSLGTKSTNSILGKTRVRIPVLTCDKRYLVAIECSLNGAPENIQINQCHQTSLSIYSIVEGKKVGSIDFNSVETTHIIDPKPKQANDVNLGHEKIRLNKTTLNLSQIDRIKCIQKGGRNTTVAFIDETGDSSFLLEINFTFSENKASIESLTMAKNWSGQLTTDGRYGLSERTLELVMGDENFGKKFEEKYKNTTGGGIYLLETMHFKPVKLFIGADKLFELSGSELYNVIGAFTKPSDRYVYIYSHRSPRIFLARLHDGQLIANYKSSVGVTQIKSLVGISDLLIVGHLDGTISTLSIANQQAADTVLSRPADEHKTGC